MRGVKKIDSVKNSRRLANFKVKHTHSNVSFSLITREHRLLRKTTRSNKFNKYELARKLKQPEKTDQKFNNKDSISKDWGTTTISKDSKDWKQKKRRVQREINNTHTDLHCQKLRNKTAPVTKTLRKHKKKPSLHAKRKRKRKKENVQIKAAKLKKCKD